MGIGGGTGPEYNGISYQIMRTYIDIKDTSKGIIEIQNNKNQLENLIILCGENILK